MNKVSLLSLLFIMSIATSFAASIQQDKMLYNIAAKTRKSLDQQGHESVETRKPEKVTLDFLNSHLANNASHFEPLEKADYDQLFNCYQQEDCALWYYQSSSSYHSGYAASAHFVMINLNSGEYAMIQHYTEAE